MKRRRKEIVAVILAAAVLAFLAACGDTRSAPLTTPTAGSPSVFASREQALSVARKLYRQYLAASDKVSKSGGDKVEQLKNYVGTTEYQQEVAAARVYSEERLRTTGDTKLREFVLQRADFTTGRIEAYACVDIADVEVVNRKNEDVTPKARDPRSTFRPTFTMSSNQLVIETNDKWPGESIC